MNPVDKNAITIGGPIGPALERTISLLFRPFRFKTWLAIGFVACLPMVGEGINPAVQLLPHVLGHLHLPNFLTMAQWVQDHMAAFILWSVVITLILGALYLFARWISSRGHFLFYDNLVKHEFAFKAPWDEFRDIGNSLFKFRLGWDLVFGNIFLAYLIITGYLAWDDIWNWMMNDRFDPTWATWRGVIFFFTAIFLSLIPTWILGMTFLHLAIPVMYIRRMKAWPAFKHVCRHMLKPRLGKCILYFLFQIVIGMVAGMLMNIGLLLSCLLAYVAMIIPLFGHYPITLFMLPALAVGKSYELHFIAQFGPEYEVPWHTPIRSGFPIIPDDPQPQTPQ